MPGLLVVMGTVSGAALNPTINCCTTDHGFFSISRKVCPEYGITSHGMVNPLRVQVRRRSIDDEHRWVQFPVRPKHLPNSGNHALPTTFNFTRPSALAP